MSGSFRYEFNDLPLVTLPGIEAAMVNGRAEISFDRDGSWQIESIEVEGHSAALRAAGKKPWVYVSAPEALASLIHGRLTGQWADKVQEAVREEIEKEWENLPDARADHRREERMGV